MIRKLSVKVTSRMQANFFAVRILIREPMVMACLLFQFIPNLL